MSPSRTRFTLIRTIRYFVTRPIALGGVAVGLAALLAFAFVVPSLLGSAFLPRTGSGEPLATSEFLRGNQSYNAQLVWGSFGDEARQALQGRGGSLSALQEQLEGARAQGFALEDVTYIGGKGLSDGTSMQFYLVGVRQQAQANLEYVPYTFTLDRGGKIARVQ